MERGEIYPNAEDRPCGGMYEIDPFLIVNFFKRPASCTRGLSAQPCRWFRTIDPRLIKVICRVTREFGLVPKGQARLPAIQGNWKFPPLHRARPVRRLSSSQLENYPGDSVP